ncbi:GPI inositol-deacylase [Papilio machaon]|uniref:GPI inositol-deacylase n=1 Tax=Papilio machaon TaxID=76193 RepID=A0A0N1II70_PAPMA|nr:GPI inositol-deacylase [Papilio machaon]
MFEYPQFVRISLNDEIAKTKYPQYGLYAYSEGRFTEKTRKMWFDGIPVLFLPGNSGSHMQARSLASVALRKAISKGYDYHFDFFTISYNEELSAFSGSVLEGQSEFAAMSVSQILCLYKSNKSVPTSVIIIGHSMGGLIAKSLLSHPITINSVNIIITLASPLHVPVVNFDIIMNNFYNKLECQWKFCLSNDEDLKQKKMIISFGSGPRDILVPPVYTSVGESTVNSLNALTTAVPGVWVSPDHVSMVWCKQLVMAINRYLFDIIDTNTTQITENPQLLMAKARLYFKANRSMTLSPDIVRSEVILPADAFWYEDNRRNYQINRPNIDKVTFLMIRLVKFPQNRFVAIETVNVNDKDWIFGCNAKFTHNTYRHCKQATSLSELSRWSGSANESERRKLATVDLQDLMQTHPDWSHVVVRVSPTKKPVTLNVDINDYYSRKIDIKPPIFGSMTIKQETEPNAIYYELVIKDMVFVHQAYLLYVEPISSCQSKQYHVSAEFHVPWAENYEYHHYFTHLKRSPMKLRLFKSNPNYTLDASADAVRVTLLLDPKCTYTISISASWYLRLGEMVRNYSSVLFPYVAAILLLATRSNMIKLNMHGMCLSVHQALLCKHSEALYAIALFGIIGMAFTISASWYLRLGEMVRNYSSVLFPYVAAILLLATRSNMINLNMHGMCLSVHQALLCKHSEALYAIALFGIIGMAFTYIPSYLDEIVTLNNQELLYFGRSLLVVGTYYAAMGIVFVVHAAILAVIVFSSQLAYRFFLRIFWRGGGNIAENVATGLRKLPIVVTLTMGFITLSCGAAALALGAAFYAFMISKMYEDYLEDYVYKLMAIIGSRICKLFSSKRPKENSELLSIDSKNDKENKEETKPESNVCQSKEDTKVNDDHDANVDEDLSKLNFHMMMLLLWLIIAIVNVPVLLTWARNFKYNVPLCHDTSYITGSVMTLCSGVIWQMDAPKRNSEYYEAVANIIIPISIIIFVLGPFTMTIVNYGMLFIFTIITVQQLFHLYYDEKNVMVNDDDVKEADASKLSSASVLNNDKNETNDETEEKSEKANETQSEKEKSNNSYADERLNEDVPDECNVCDENRIYKVFKNLRDKFSSVNDM